MFPHWLPYSSVNFVTDCMLCYARAETLIPKETGILWIPLYFIYVHRQTIVGVRLPDVEDPAASVAAHTRARIHKLRPSCMRWHCGARSAGSTT